MCVVIVASVTRVDKAAIDQALGVCSPRWVFHLLAQQGLQVGALLELVDKQ